VTEAKVSQDATQLAQDVKAAAEEAVEETVPAATPIIAAVDPKVTAMINKYVPEAVGDLAAWIESVEQRLATLKNKTWRW